MRVLDLPSLKIPLPLFSSPTLSNNQIAPLDESREAQPLRGIPWLSPLSPHHLCKKVWKLKGWVGVGTQGQGREQVQTEGKREQFVHLPL